MAASGVPAAFGAVAAFLGESAMIVGLDLPDVELFFGLGLAMDFGFAMYLR